MKPEHIGYTNDYMYLQSQLFHWKFYQVYYPYCGSQLTTRKGAMMDVISPISLLQRNSGPSFLLYFLLDVFKHFYQQVDWTNIINPQLPIIWF